MAPKPPSDDTPDTTNRCVSCAVSNGTVWPVWATSAASRLRRPHRPLSVNLNADGTPGDDWSGRLDLGGDGRYALFETQSTNLAPTQADFYLKDLQTGDILPIDPDLVGESSGCIERADCL